jgi:uncharacterized RDD family membrane protein YckC
MESGPPPPERPRPDDAPAEGPASPPGPQAPAPGPQAPAPGYAPPGPQAPPPGYAPAPGAPPAGPEGIPGYGGPVPPGGWQQPIARPPGWSGAPLASWGSRVGAWFIDLVVVIVIFVVVLLVIAAIAGGLSELSEGAAIVTAIVFGLTFVIALFFYAPLLMMRSGPHNGQTLGKQAVGIRVVRDNGQPMGFGWSALREVVLKGLVPALLNGFFIGWLVQLVDYLWPLWDDQNRALHDMVVSTHVVRT